MYCDLCGEDHQTDQHYNLTDDAYMGAPDVSDPGVSYIQEPQVIDVNPVVDTEDYAPIEDFTPPKETTRTAGVAKDFMALANAAKSGEAEVILGAMEQFSKSQLVRFLDISVLGPLMLFWAYRGKLSKMERFMLGMIGAGTVVYSGRNYLKNKKIIQPPELAAIKAKLFETKLS